MGIIALSHKNTREAIEKLEESVKLDKSDPQAFYNLAGAYSMVKKYDLALKNVTEVLTDFRDALINLLKKYFPYKRPQLI
jgi:tetratricopeptide (TPR) repeat protein